MNQCELCNAPADGLDDIHCQIHWEEICSDALYEQIFNTCPHCGHSPIYKDCSGTGVEKWCLKCNADLSDIAEKKNND